MKDIQSFYLAFIVITITGCATPRLPTFVSAPVPPVGWNVLLEEKVGCPNVTGQYELVPQVADLQKDGLWHVSIGNWYDYLLLIPFDRVSAHNLSSNDNLPIDSRFNLLFESKDQGRMLRITSPDKNAKNFATHAFSEAEKDYECQAGNLIFPEFQIQGGTEGSFLSGKIYRQATITSIGDLLFYEQIQSHKTVHRYYLFKLKNSSDTSG